MVSRGRLYDASLQDGFIAWEQTRRIGLVTYAIRPDGCEITTLESLTPGHGIGSRLLETVRRAASRAGSQRVWLITTNDNTTALRFYQRQGWRIVAWYRDSITQSRLLKPQIPLLGIDDIPIRDEIELEILPLPDDTTD